MDRQTGDSKDVTIEELTEVVSKMTEENSSLKQQIEKLKNIAANMHRELTNSRKSF